MGAISGSDPVACRGEHRPFTSADSKISHRSSRAAPTAEPPRWRVRGARRRRELVSEPRAEGIRGSLSLSPELVDARTASGLRGCRKGDGPYWYQGKISSPP